MSEISKPLNPEQELQPASTELSPQQLATFTDYVHGSTDRHFNPDAYRSVTSRMNALSQQAGIDENGGRLVITAATVGAMTRDPRAFELSARGLMKRMKDDLGLSEPQTKVFQQLIGRFRTSQGRPDVVGHSLSGALQAIKQRAEQHGEDSSVARVAFLASAFAATKDRGLRLAIHRDLEAASRKPVQ